MPTHSDHTGEPDLTTAAELRPVLDALISREPLFHRPRSGGEDPQYDTLIDHDFWEVGASGRRYSRNYVLAVLASREAQSHSGDIWATEDFHCRKLAAEVYLLTYTLHQGQRKTRRTTVWRQTAQGWKALFHQGTVVQES
jgi:hypothetical protein